MRIQHKHFLTVSSSNCRYFPEVNTTYLNIKFGKTTNYDGYNNQIKIIDSFPSFL